MLGQEVMNSAEKRRDMQVSTIAIVKELPRIRIKLVADAACPEHWRRKREAHALTPCWGRVSSGYFLQPAGEAGARSTE